MAGKVELSLEEKFVNIKFEPKFFTVEAGDSVPLKITYSCDQPGIFRS